MKNRGGGDGGRRAAARGGKPRPRPPAPAAPQLLSVVMPAYRLAAAIAGNVLRVDAVLSSLGLPYEIVPVDDGSGDGTAEALTGPGPLAALRAAGRLRPVVLAENAGKGNALRAGFRASRGDLVLLLDADLDLAPEMLPAFLDAMGRAGADIVIGSKRHPESEIDYPWRRRLASAVYYGVVRLLTGLPVTDTQTGMKLFRRPALAWAFDRMLVKRYAFDVELLAIAHDAGFKVAEAPVKMEFGDKRGALTLDNVKTVLTDTFAIFYRLRVIRYYQSVALSEIPDPPPGVSVVIACPGPSRYLDEALAGLAGQTLPPLEAVVLPDAPFAAPAGLPFALRIVPTGKVRPAEKRNIGIREARGDIVAFLDDDASPQPQWLAQAVRHFSRAEVGASGGPAITPPGDPRMAALGGDVYASPLVSGACRYRYVSERFRAVDDLPSCNLLVRASLLRRIGGYETRYWPGEDTLLCRAIAQSGFQIVYDPFAVVLHHRRPLFGPHLRQVGRYALHRGFFARAFPENSLHLSYMAPSIFVLGVALGAPAAALAPALAPVYLGALALYGAATLLFSIRRRPLDGLAVWAGIVLTHLWYGVRFLQGLLFGRMPREARDFDHGGAAPKEGA